MLEKLFLEMISYYSGDPKRIQHFTKVHSYAKLIAEAKDRFSDITESMKARSEQLLADADNAGREIGRQIADGYCGAGQEN